MRGRCGVLDGWFGGLKNVTGFRNLFSGDVLKVGVFEEGGVFETEAEETVHRDMCDPYEGDGRGRVPV